MTKPRLLDLFCGAGGAGMGYHLAGFEVIGVDLKPQPRYPFEFHQADALTFPLDGFDVIHASPPCQRYSNMAHCRGNHDEHPDLIDPTRMRLMRSGVPCIIENVIGASLINPSILCGAMFAGLKVYRHRLFETSFALLSPGHPRHRERIPRAGRGANAHGWISVVGGGPDTGLKRTAMQIDWMTRDELSQAIPPAYTRFIGEHALRILQLGKESVA